MLLLKQYAVIRYKPSIEIALETVTNWTVLIRQAYANMNEIDSVKRMAKILSLKLIKKILVSRKTILVIAFKMFTL